MNAVENRAWSLIEAESLGAAWLHCLGSVLESGSLVNDGPDVLKELCNVSMTIHSFLHCDRIVKRWCDPARIDLMKKKYTSCHILPQYKISYGKLLYENNGVNQIQWVIDRLQQKPETKSATISLHHPGEGVLSCLSLLDFKMRSHFLNLTAIYRSQNVFASQPGNAIALRETQEYVAGSLGCLVGSMNLVVISAHVYERDFTTAQKVLREAQDEGVV
jgi:thymidylate synthase